VTEKQQTTRPEWAPEGGAEGFASYVMSGVKGGHDGMPGAGRPRSQTPRRARKTPGAEDCQRGIESGDRTMLARAITLVESNAPAHHAIAREVLTRIMERTGKARRIGISGPPGAGKSSLIEALGERLCGRGHTVAVLAIDPSSTITGGSILGDKTRMEKLARNPRAFIRPSPAGGTLGGVARKTRETMLLCEAFGCDVVLVETVGVGQSEVTVRSMVDCFVLLQIAGAGDELQGIKKGVIELADLIVVNKADGDNLARARHAQADLRRVLRFLQPATEGWQTPALTASAHSGAGVPEMWQMVEDYFATVLANGVHARRRHRQNVDWLHSLLDEALRRRFHENPAKRAKLENLSAKVGAGQIPATVAVEELLGEW
jgi:LAO/AO transport system kinase